MRLKKYLKEELPDVDGEQIFSDCTPYFKQLVSDNFSTFLYSGRKGSLERAFRKKVRKDREPRDTPKGLHDLINSKFEERLGVKARSEALFTFPNSDLVVRYGDPYYVFPMGENFSFVYSNQIDDLTQYIEMQLNGKYGKDVLYLLGLLDKNEYLEWTDFKDTYVAPEKTSPSKNLSNKPSITKEEYLNDMYSVVDKAMDTYTRTKSLKNVNENSEVMIICDSVGLLKEHIIKPKNLAEGIKDNL